MLCRIGLPTKISTDSHRDSLLNSQARIAVCICSDCRVTLDPSPLAPASEFSISIIRSTLFFLHRIIKVFTLALPCGKSLFVLPMCKITLFHTFSQIRHAFGLFFFFFFNIFCLFEMDMM